MTGNQQETQSQFNARADDAARALRQNLRERGAQIPESRTVEVGPDGKPPQAPPPEGSYARQAMDLQQQQAQQLAQQPVQPEPEMNGHQPAQVPPPQETAEQQLSGNAQRRISDLVTELRRADQERQQALLESQQQKETLAQMQSRMESLQTQHQQLIEQNLDNLDPETRMQVMQDARLQEVLTNFERQLMGKIKPELESAKRFHQQSEMSAIANVYPAFQMEVHGPLIDMFMERNPACTADQAFRAIAEPGELATQSTASAAVVPPIVHPGGGTSPRYVPDQQEQKSDPEQELIEDSRRIAKLRRSLDPDEQKQGYDMILKNLGQRLGPRFQ